MISPDGCAKVLCYLLTNFLFQQVTKSLLQVVSGIEGATVENNKFCVSVHYRNVAEKVKTVFFSVILFSLLPSAWKMKIHLTILLLVCRIGNWSRGS